MNITAGQKRAAEYLKTIKIVVDHQDCASIANIIYGHSIHHEPCVRDLTRYLQSISVKASSEEIEQLILVTRDALR
jgi:hypothetical protein